MTRTARAMYPRAITRDRSVAKSGLDAATKKGGSGNHSWGSLHQEYDYERAGAADAKVDAFKDYDDQARDQVYLGPAMGVIAGNVDNVVDSENSSVDGVDGTHSDGRVRSGSTASNSGVITDDERARARKFRTGSFNSTRNVDLASIARTSVGVSGSPPAEVNIRPAGGLKNS